MIVANLATYPPRRDGMLDVVRALAPQVDRLNVVLNEYDVIPAELASIDRVVPVIPEENTMDVGKFYVQPAAEDLVMYVDDDIYPRADFVSRSVERFCALGPGKWLGGYHGVAVSKKAVVAQAAGIPEIFFPAGLQELSPGLGHRSRVGAGDCRGPDRDQSAIIRGEDDIAL